MIKTQIRLQYILLLFFPAVFLILQVLIKTDYTYFFLSSHDPAYGYLFNGLNLAQGNMQLGLAAHPGTPLTFLVALNLSVIHLFSGGTGLAASVLNNPEYYLNMISIEIVIFNTMALWLLGYRTYRKMNNLPLSLAFQVTPFITLQGIGLDSMVMLEPLLLFIEILILMILAEYAFGSKESLSGRDLIFTAVLMSLGIATKIVFIPLLFLPFFVLSGTRNKLIYVVTTILSLAVFLIPIYRVFPSFLTWIRDLFIHSGVYGSGKTDILDIAKFKENIGSIVRANYAFTGCFLLVMATAVLILIPRLRTRVDPAKRKMILGLALVFLLNVLIVAKHYSSHYLIVSYNLVVFGFILVLSIGAGLFLTKREAFPAWPVKTAAIFIVGTGLVISLVYRIHFSPKLTNPRLKGLEFVEKTIGDTRRIIVLENPCPFIETALYHGYAFSGGMKSAYVGILKESYPESFFYSMNEDVFHDWNKEYNLIRLLSGSSKTYLYYSSKADTLPPILLTRLNDLIRNGDIQPVKTAFTDPDSREFIYEIDADTFALANRIIKHEVADYQMDKTAPDKYPMQLSKDNPFGPVATITLKKGYYSITAMRKTPDQKGFIVAEDKSGMGLYKANGIAGEGTDGWDKLELVVDVPEKLIGKEMAIYLWYPGKETCSFDDVTITWYEIQ